MTQLDLAAPAPPPLPPGSAPDPYVGRTIGGCKLVRLLGRGGMASVYLGEEPSGPVAFKLLHADLAGDEGQVQRFIREARVLALIGGEHIVQVLRVGVDAAGPYLVMELLEGQTISAFLAKHGRLPEPQAVRLLRQLAGALERAHSHGVVHRDLKPENIFLVDAGGEPLVKVLDFGLAKLLDAPEGGGPTTRTGALMGTPAYMSPEQCRGEAADERSDLYSLGVIAFQLATGELPFEARGPASMLLAHQRTSPPTPRSRRPELSEAFERIVLTLLAKRREDRYSTAAEVSRALEAIAQRG